jgi:anti-sigma regulatory factor (Ser/Thr protein kinase)
MSSVFAATHGGIDGKPVEVGERVVEYARQQERLSHRRHLRATTERSLEAICNAAECVEPQELVRLAAGEASQLRAYVEWLGRHEGCDLIVALRRVVAEAAMFGHPEVRLAPGPMDNTLPGAEAEALARQVRQELNRLRSDGFDDPITMSAQERHGEALVRLRTNGFEVIAEFRRGAAMLSGGVARATIGHRVEEARASERRNLRCALHDTALQTLEYLGTDGYDSGLVREEIVGLAERALIDLTEVLDRDTADEACELLPGLRRVVSDSRAVGRMDVELVTGAVDESVHGEEAAALVAAVREALNNVRKHAHARRVIVSCETSEGEARITVRDDGVGFDPATATHGIGILNSIADRVTEHGGRARLHSAPGRGVLVTLTMAGGSRRL